MFRTLLATTAALSLLAGAAWAQSVGQSVTDQVVSGLQAQGFTRIEVKEGPTQIKVEAIQGTTKVEYVYDIRTGDVLSQETERVDGDDDTRPGVEIDQEDEDFVRAEGAVLDGDDDSGRDDDGEDDDRDSDDSDDRGGDDDSDGRGDDSGEEDDSGRDGVGDDDGSGRGGDDDSDGDDSDGDDDGDDGHSGRGGDDDESDRD